MDTILKYFSDFTHQQLEQLKALGLLYPEWNDKINVISRKDIDSLYEKHVLHSLSIAVLFSFEEGTQIADLGCGGGFPGIPLAIFFPQVHFHLIDSIAKKLTVVDAIAGSIGLKNVTTQHSRVEDIKNRRFDFVVSRAVAPLKDLWKWSKPLLAATKPGRKNQPGNISVQQSTEPVNYQPGLICLKGGNLDQEIAESETRPRIVPVREVFDLPFFQEKYLLYLPVSGNR